MRPILSKQLTFNAYKFDDNLSIQKNEEKKSLIFNVAKLTCINIFTRH